MDCVNLWAITLRMLLMGMSVKVSVGTEATAGAAGGLGLGAAGVGAGVGLSGTKLLISFQVTLPSGPVPVTWAMSIPFSAASFLARGLANTLPFSGAAELAGAVGGVGLGAAGAGGGAAT